MPLSPLFGKCMCMSVRTVGRKTSVWSGGGGGWTGLRGREWFRPKTQHFFFLNHSDHRALFSPKTSFIDRQIPPGLSLPLFFPSPFISLSIFAPPRLKKKPAMIQRVRNVFEEVSRSEEVREMEVEVMLHMCLFRYLGLIRNTLDVLLANYTPISIGFHLLNHRRVFSRAC